MPNPSNVRPRWQADLIFLVPCLVVALLVRVFFFNGVSLGDDVGYWMQSIATGLYGDWPPLKLHWHTRIALVLPCALLLKLFGLKIWVPYIFTMLGGLTEIVLTYYIARRLTSEGIARLAAWLCVFFPLNILYSSYLFVDLWAGVLGALSLYYWYRGMATDRIRHFVLASTFFGLAWLTRETILMCLPIFLVLLLFFWRSRTPKILWVVPPALLIVAGEALLYQLTADNWHYRFDAVLATRSQLVTNFLSPKSFWLQPFVTLLNSHELGIFMATALGVAVFKFSSYSKPLALWLLAGFVWLNWGTTLPYAWAPLQGDPRYLTVLTIPCMILVAAFTMSLRRIRWRVVVVAGWMISGLVCSFMDLGTIKLTAYERFTQSRYNLPETTLEPFDYFGARAAQKFQTNNAQYACATDLGRFATMKQLNHLPGTRLVSSSAARYLVLSPQTHYEKTKSKRAEGWRTVAVIKGKTNPLRNFVVKFLTYFGQPGHREPIVRWPVLVVLENPAWPPAAPPSPSP
jgi:hypothetical protein